MLKPTIRTYTFLVFASMACTACTAVSAGAQISPQVSAPVLGYVVDGAHQLRPMVGIAGAATVGPSIDSGFDVMQAVVPPGHDYILAATRENGWPQLLQVRGNAITAQTLAPSGLESSAPGRASGGASGGDESACDRQGVDEVSFSSRSPRRTQCAPTRSRPEQTSIERIALSPAGSAAALYSDAERRIYVFANLAQAAALLGSVSIGQPGAVSALGISDDGKTVAFGISAGDSGGMFVATLGEPARLVSRLRHPSAIAFLRGSDSAIVADDADDKIFAFRAGQVFAIAGAEDGVSQPVGIAVSNDNQRVFVGNAATGSVLTIGPGGGVSGTASCKCRLTGLNPTNADSVFRLTEFSGGPVLLFDGSGASSRIVFVPAGSSPF